MTGFWVRWDFGETPRLKGETWGTRFVSRFWFGSIRVVFWMRTGFADGSCNRDCYRVHISFAGVLPSGAVQIHWM